MFLEVFQEKLEKKCISKEVDTCRAVGEGSLYDKTLQTNHFSENTGGAAVHSLSEIQYFQCSR